MARTIPNGDADEYVLDDGTELFIVPSIWLAQERLLPMFPASRGEKCGVDLLEHRFGVRPSRSTIHRWRTNGCPVAKHGPRVLLPSVTQVGRLKTSPEALVRFFRTWQNLGDEIQAAGGVTAWRDSRT